jgi:uncharacterized protein (DUF2141 family)
MKRGVLSILPFCACLFLQAQNIELRINHIKNENGTIQIMVFQDSLSYHRDNPFQILRFQKATMVKGEMTIALSLKPGEYGIILLDDENDTEVMEYNVLGLPKEGFGFAGYYHRGIRRPEFDDFKFTVGSERIIREIRVKYF